MDDRHLLPFSRSHITFRRNNLQQEATWPSLMCWLYKESSISSIGLALTIQIFGIFLKSSSLTSRLRSGRSSSAAERLLMRPTRPPVVAHHPSPFSFVFVGTVWCLLLPPYHVLCMVVGGGPSRKPQECFQKLKLMIAPPSAPTAPPSL